uniref:Immunoglobulin V-set domain-containing protein n=1 Tax=Scophthalmus maximus TaxID=52904 RepID=A0A8D3DUT4_SCOMX
MKHLMGGSSSGQPIMGFITEEFSVEGRTVTLSYDFSRAAASNDYFFWYRQDPGKPPEFLVSHSGTGQILNSRVSGLSVTVSGDKTQMDMKISSAAVTDSAVYYCALRPTVTGNTKPLYKNTTQTPHQPLEANKSIPTWSTRGSQGSILGPLIFLVHVTNTSQQVF